MQIETVRGPALLLVDDHAILREGVKRILERLPAAWTIIEAETGHQALECLRQWPFSLAIIDLSMRGMNGLELIRRIKAECPALPVLVLSTQTEEQYALRSFRAGASGYLAKDSAAKELQDAVEKLVTGGTYLTHTLAERMVYEMSGATPPARHARLSDRELEVIERIVAGERLTDIAAALNLSVKTVSSHKTRIQEKLQVHSTAGLIRYGLQHRIERGAYASLGLDPAYPENPLNGPERHRTPSSADS